MLPYIAYMDPMGLMCRSSFQLGCSVSLASNRQISPSKSKPPDSKRHHKSFWTTNSWSPMEPLKSPWKKQPMAHDHLRWVPWIPIPWGMLPWISLAGEINATNRMGSKGQLAETFAELQKVLSWKCVVQSCFLTNCASSCLWDMGILQIFLDFPK